MTRTIDLESVRLYRGTHEEPNGKKEGCLLEWASYLAGEPWSDHPDCVSPVIAAFGRRWNDDLSDDDRQILLPYLPKILNTRGTEAQESKRAWMVTDWMVRVHLLAWLELAGLTEQATAVRGLPMLTSATKWKKAEPTVRKARKEAAAAWDAARDAAWDAARDAAWAAARAAAWDAAGAAAWDAAWAAARAAARDAAWDAARAAAGDAARDAAWDAARDAAWDAARAALKPTVTSLQASALTLLDDLISVTGGGLV
jgi:hypothetical protein